MTLNIANGRDRKILYNINNVRLIDKKRAARGAVPSTDDGRGSLTKSNSHGKIVAEKKSVVKGKSAETDILTNEEFQVKYGLKLRAVDEIGKGADSQAVENAESFSIDSAGDEGYEKCRAWSSADVHRTSAFLIFKSLFLNTHAK